MKNKIACTDIFTPEESLTEIYATNTWHLSLTEIMCKLHKLAKFFLGKHIITVSAF